MHNFIVEYGYLSYNIPRTGYWHTKAWDRQEAVELFYKYHIKGHIINITAL